MHLAIAPKNPLGSSVYASIIGDESITSNILKSIVSGISIPMNNGYNYAKKDYDLKLPTGKTTQPNILTDVELANLIKINIGYSKGVVCLESGYEEYSNKLRVIRFLTLTRQYSSSNNIVLNYPGYTDTEVYKVMLNSITLNVDDLYGLIAYDVYVKTYTSIYDTDGFIVDTVIDWVLDISTHSESVLLENTFILPADTLCFYAIYQKYDKDGLVLPTKYTWFCNLTTGLYPELTEPTTKFKEDTFLPVIPIRYNNVDLTDVSLKDTSLYKTSKRLLNILRMPFEYLGTQINNNPSVGDIDHAYVMFGVDLQTVQSESLQYLNLFFNRVHELNAYSNYKISASAGIDFLEYGLNLKLSYDSVTSEILEGMLDVAKMGTTTKSIQLGLVDKLVLDTKISKTLIRRITVSNLVLTNYIYGDKAIATGIRSVKTDSKNHNLIIPIQYSIANSMSTISRNALYTDGTLMVINSVVETKVEWYEEGWFKFVVIIVMVIILVIVTIASWGTMTAWWATLCANIVAGAYAAAAMMILVPVLVSMAMGYAAKWIVVKYGAQWGVIGAILLTAIAVISQQYGVLADIMKTYLLSSAQTALQMGMALISAANEFLIAEAKDIANEYEAFTTVADKAREELKAKQDLLENAYDVDPLSYVKPVKFRMVLGETPDAFIQRTLGLVENTMYILHEEIPNYFSNRLKLPRLVTEDMYGSNFRV
jgi:hypothetical protein